MADPIISFGGIASGLDTKSIVAALVAVRAKPINLLQSRQNDFELLRSRYKSLQTRVEALQSAAEDIKKADDFLAFEASSSDESKLKVNADGSASEGSFTVDVLALAKAETEVSGGYAAVDSVVGSGTLQITVGGTANDIVIDPAKNTLEDIRDAINDEGIGVTATIVNTGEGTDPHKLVITSDKTGVENDISFDLTGFTGSLSFTQQQAAANSSIQVNGLTISRDSNVIDDVVNGVSFTLQSEGVSTVTVTPDLSSIKGKINAYVQAHNDLISYIDSEIKVSEVGQKGGAFNGESTVRNIKNRILSQFGSASFPGGSLSTLNEVGLSIGSDGLLSFDGEKFDEVAAEKLGEVTALLTTKGDFVDEAGFQIDEVPDSLASGEYAIQVTQAATKAETTASQPFGGGGTLAQDETLTITVGLESVDVSLTAGTDLETAISQINDALDDADIQVTASDDGGSLKLAADDYGSALSFDVVSDVAAGASSTGVGTSTVNATGVDVAGTIDGTALVGEGQYLSGAEDGSFEGLKIKFVGDAPTSTDLTVGPDGFFVRIDELLGDFLQSEGGAIDARLDGIDDTIHDISDRIDSLEDRVLKYQELLERQFTALEGVIGQLQSQSGILATFKFPSFQGNS